MYVLFGRVPAFHFSITENGVFMPGAFCRPLLTCGQVCFLCFLSLAILPSLSGFAPPPKSGKHCDRYSDPLPPQAVCRFGSVRLRYRDRLTSVQFSPDGKLLATESLWRFLVWDTKTGKKIAKITGFSPVTYTFSPDAKKLVLGTNSGTLSIYNIRTGKKKTIKTIHNQLWSLSVSTNKSILTSFGTIKEGGQLAICYWNSCTWKISKKLVIPTNGEVAKALFDPQTNTVLVKDADGLRYWRISQGMVRRLRSPTKRLSWSVRWSRNGKWFAERKQKQVELWDVVKKRRLHQFREKDTIDRMRFHPSKFQLVTTAGSFFSVWDIATGKRLLRQRTSHWSTLDVAFSPSGQLMAMVGRGSNAVFLWDWKKKKLVHQFFSHRDTINTIAYSPVLNIVASGTICGMIRFWDAKTSKHLYQISIEDAVMSKLAFSPDGKTLAIGMCGDLTKTSPNLALWHLPTKKFLHKFYDEPTQQWGARTRAISFSGDGKKMAASDGLRRVTIRDPRTGKTLQRIACEDASYVSLSPDGRIIALSGNKPELQVWDLTQKRLLRKIPYQVPYGDGVRGIDFSPNGRMFVSAVALPTPRGTIIQLWETLTVQKRFEFKIKVWRIHGVQFSSCGKYLVCHLGLNSPITLIIYDVLTGKKVKEIQGHDGEIKSFFVSRKRPIVITGSDDCTGLLWDLHKLIHSKKRMCKCGQVRE